MQADQRIGCQPTRGPAAPFLLAHPEIFCITRRPQPFRPAPQSFPAGLQ